MNEQETRRSEVPRWREDFPIGWESDHYITRRELAKFLTLGSALLAGISGVIVVVGRWFRHPQEDGPRVRVARASSIPPDGSLLFRYPTDEDACILVRNPDGELCAYSQICTHLSCAVVHRPGRASLFCPCHHGWFDAQSGLATGGPPTRRLPRIRIEVVGDDVYALGKKT